MLLFSLEQLLFDVTSPDSAENLDGVVNVNDFELFSEHQGEHQDDIDIPDLFDLPIEDFFNINSNINELDNATDCAVSSGYNACNCDYCADYFSDHSSSEVDQETQAEYKELLDSINESAFLSNPTGSSLEINSSLVVQEGLSFNSSTSTYINDDSPCASSNEVIEPELCPELQEEHKDDIEIPYLSDLPIEDFVNIYLNINELDNVTDCGVSSGLNACSPETSSDYCVDNSSDQISPEVDKETQAEYMELLDSIDEGAFFSNPTGSSLVINSSSVVEKDLSFNSSTSTYINDDSPCASSNEAIELELCPELQEEHQDDIEIPYLSDLPIEDFVNIYLNINELDNVTDCGVSSGFNACSPETSSDYCVDNSIDQISPEVDKETQAEYMELLDSIDEGAFFSNPTGSSLVINSSSVVEKDLSFNSSTSTYINDDSPCASYNEVSDDILAMLNEQYGVSHDLTAENIVEKCAFKRIRDTSVEDAVVTKKKRVDDYSVPPSPILSVLSDTSDSSKTTLRRIKNNEASCMTRAKRKAKHSSLFQKETELTNDNAQMKIQIERMQKAVDLLRKLILIFSGISSN